LPGGAGLDRRGLAEEPAERRQRRLRRVGAKRRSGRRPGLATSGRAGPRGGGRRLAGVRRGAEGRSFV